MGKLRDKMEQDLDLKGFSPKTKKAYLGVATRFVKHYMKSPEIMGEEEVRTYLLYLQNVKKHSNSAMTTAYSGLRFLYETTMKRDWESFKIPRVKTIRKMPKVMTKVEVNRIIDATKNMKHKAILMTTYASGLRVGEVVKLRHEDIQPERNRIFVKQGKGNKDRYTVLSKKNYEYLQEYIQRYRPQNWLFEGEYQEKHICERTVQDLFSKILKELRIEQNYTVHSLRHAFATHMIQNGTDVVHVQRMLGHACIKTTMVYVHLSHQDDMNIKSPFDRDDDR